MNFLSHCKTGPDRLQNLAFKRGAHMGYISVRQFAWFQLWMLVTTLKAACRIRKF